MSRSRVNGDNLIINGNMDIWQRGVSFTGVPHEDYTADRWQWQQNGPVVIDMVQGAAPDSTSEQALTVDVTTADVAIAAGDYAAIMYHAEGLDALRLALGTSEAKTFTLSFLVRATDTGIHCVAFRNAALNRTYVAEYTIAVADTYQRVVITVDGDTSGTWATDNTSGLDIIFTLATGSTFQTPAGSWAAGNFLGSSNQVNGISSTAHSFFLSQVKLEIGSSATPFESRLFGDELVLCQRYYEKSYNIDVDPGTVTPVGEYRWRSSNVTEYVTMKYAVQKRATTTAVTYSAITGASGNIRNHTVIADAASTETSQGSGSHVVNATVTDNDLLGLQWTADAEL